MNITLLLGSWCSSTLFSEDFRVTVKMLRRVRSRLLTSVGEFSFLIKGDLFITESLFGVFEVFNFDVQSNLGSRN